MKTIDDFNLYKQSEEQMLEEVKKEPIELANEELALNESDQ